MDGVDRAAIGLLAHNVRVLIMLVDKLNVLTEAANAGGVRWRAFGA
jgi:hypothetical protein